MRGDGIEASTLLPQRETERASTPIGVDELLPEGWRAEMNDVAHSPWESLDGARTDWDRVVDALFEL